jgi:hypothetical protein
MYSNYDDMYDEYQLRHFADMKWSDDGRMIHTCIRNIKYDSTLTTPAEMEQAKAIAKLIKGEGTNWVPAHVKQILPRKYQLIGSPVILEAVKLAGLDLIRCFQVPSASEQQILKIQKILESAQMPARPKKIRRPKQRKALVSKHKYFQSEGQRIIYSLLELSGTSRQKALDITVEHYGDKALARTWYDNLAKIINSDTCLHPDDADTAMFELEEMYMEMTWETPSD